MTARHIALGVALAAGYRFPQSTNTPEIRGTVTEYGLEIGLTGAEVTLFEFVLDAERTVIRTQVATTSTDTRGAFRFPLEHFGEYYVEVRKEGYSGVIAARGGTGTRADVNRDHPTQQVQFALTRPGEISGRVLDEDGKPVAGMNVGAQNKELGFGSVAVTDKDGGFTVAKLAPGEYLIRITPNGGDFATVEPGFSNADLKSLDQDYEAASWPVPVSPGASSSVGTITVRKVPYYRARVSVLGADCGPKESLSFAAFPASPLTTFPCGDAFSVRNLKPGSYWFVLRNAKPGENNRWALSSVEVTRENVEVSLAMSPAAEIGGVIIPAEGATLPKFEKIGIMMRARPGTAFLWTAVAGVDPEGRFFMKNLPWVRHDVSVNGLSDRYYVKEIRYNGMTMPDGLVTPVQDAPAQKMEIVIDDQPATITGTVRDGDKPASEPYMLVVKWPFTEGDVPVSGERLMGDKDGRFRISGLAPGEYRVMALTRIVRINQISTQLLSNAQRVTVERGSSKDLTLKLADPPR